MLDFRMNILFLVQAALKVTICTILMDKNKLARDHCEPLFINNRFIEKKLT